MFVIVFAIPFYTLLLALFSPWIVQEMWRDWRGRRRLRREGRWLTWDAARRRLEADDGVLLVEVGPKGLGGACWVPTDALDSECPLPGVVRDADWFGRV